jgi:excisionase family DNA binding protein
MSITLPKLVPAPPIAESLGVTPWRIYELVRQNRIPHVRLGRSVRFDPAKIAAWIEAGGSWKTDEEQD